MDTLPYDVGDMVKHIKFGKGKVLEIVSGGRDYEVTVDFESRSEKNVRILCKTKKSRIK